MDWATSNAVSFKGCSGDKTHDSSVCTGHGRIEDHNVI